MTPLRASNITSRGNMTKNGFMLIRRAISSSPLSREAKSNPTAIVIGAYSAKGDQFIFSKSTAQSQQSLLSQRSLEHIQKQLIRSQFKGNVRDVRVLYDVEGLESIVVVTGLGKPSSKGVKDAARHGAAAAVQSLKSIVGKKKDSDVDVNNDSSEAEAHSPSIVLLDGLGDWKSAAEGATLVQFELNDFKSKKSSSFLTTQPLSKETSVVEEWRRGTVLSQAQNLARKLKETPANYLNPTQFAENAVKLFQGIPNVQVHVRDLDWIQDKKMGAFLSVSRGSDQPPKFLEIHYTGGETAEPPIAFVGKGVTFDSGGISLKPSRDMHLMKGDMGGAAAVLSTLWGVSQLGLRTNVIACIPLTENMPNGKATKPGDVVTAMNGKTIEIQNTDAEGRLILADAIYYTATTYNPSALVEISTLTGAMDVALGAGYSGVFSTCDTLWDALKTAGNKSSDQFWRMPLDPHYTSLLKSTVADLNNIGPGSAGSCTAAAFLKEFLPVKQNESALNVAEDEKENDDSETSIPFAHIDIAGVMYHRGLSDSLIPSGMTGRPTRSLIEFVTSKEK